MSWTRARDRATGAVAMLLALVLGTVVAWWAVSDPAGGVGPDATSPHRSASRPDQRPPADLGEDEVWLGDLGLRSGTVVTRDSRLRDVRASGRDVVTGPGGLVAGRVAVRATVPFHVVAAELGEGTVVRAADGGQAEVLRRLEVVGRELRVEATGTVEVRDGRLVVVPRSIDLGGPQLLSEALAAVVRELVTITHDIEGLPDGLVLRDVEVRPDGFRARLSGEDVRLVP